MRKRHVTTRILDWYSLHGPARGPRCADALGIPGGVSAIAGQLLRLQKIGKLLRHGERGRYTYSVPRAEYRAVPDAKPNGTHSSKSKTVRTMPGSWSAPGVLLGGAKAPIVDPMLDFSTGALQGALSARIVFLERQLEKVKTALEALQ